MDYSQDSDSQPEPMMDVFAAYSQPVQPPATTGGGAKPHPQAQKTLMAVILAAVVVVIILILYQVMSPRTLAKNLARSGWVVYYRKGCGYCTKQESALDGKYRKSIECDASGNQIGGYTSSPPLACGSSQITGFPFWYNTKTKETRVGLQAGDALEKMAQQ